MQNTLLDEACDNRRACRYEPVQSAVHLGWWAEPEFRSVPGGLKNVSSGGALVETDVRPPRGESLWLCMSNLPIGDWAEMSVVSVTPRAGEAPDRFHVRLQFREGCPYEMFSLAVHGISAGH